MRSIFLFCQGCRGVCRGGRSPPRPARAVRHRLSAPDAGDSLVGCLTTRACLPRGVRDTRAIGETAAQGAWREHCVKVLDMGRPPFLQA